MEELLRQAAENYPLNTDSANWEDLRSRMNNRNAESVSKEKDNRRWLLLLLLLPLAFGIYRYVPFGGTKHQPDNGNQPVEKKTALQPASTSQPVITNQQVPAQAEKINTPAYQPANTIAKNISFTPRRSTKPLLHAQINREPDQASTDQNNIPPLNDNKEKPAPVVVTGGNETGVEKIIGEKVAEPQKDVTANKELPSNDNPAAAKKGRSKSAKDHFVYAGIVGGPDLSLIKFQELRKAGVNIGILTGYQMNRWSVEAGFLWNKKYYGSKGEYFSTKKINLPSTAKIMQVEGNCKMTEIPVSVQYTFIAGKKSKWKADAGISSYFMKQETYKYTIVSTGQPYPYKKTYNNDSSFTLATANAGISYNRQLGRGIQLRLEPYVKIPLKGVGIGSLPITSLGINVALTKKIF